MIEITAVRDLDESTENKGMYIIPKNDKHEYPSNMDSNNDTTNENPANDTNNDPETKNTANIDKLARVTLLNFANIGIALRPLVVQQIPHFVDSDSSIVTNETGAKIIQNTTGCSVVYYNVA